MQQDNIIYDWNLEGDRHSPPMRRVEFFDETLRDGIQCPSVSDPPIEKKMEILQYICKERICRFNLIKEALNCSCKLLICWACSAFPSCFQKNEVFS